MEATNIMGLQTNLSGRLRNTDLPITNSLHPLFEAVVNSIYAIEEAGLSNEDGRITIEIVRKHQGQLQFKDSTKKKLEEILGFKIIDNGIGFTDTNMKAFNTLDTEHKIEKGGRGVGRLLWLKAFERVNVESIFTDNGGNKKQRKFRFDVTSGVASDPIESTTNNKSTMVHLDGFNERYRERSLKTAKAIADSIVEHCLFYFIRPGNAPLITIVDAEESISLQELFESHMHSTAVSETVTIQEESFDLLHVRLRSNASSAHSIALCADNRLVIEEKIEGKIPGLRGKVSDSKGEFIYSCYVSSTFLDNNVRPERTKFNLVESVEDLFEKTEISLSDILHAVMAKAKGHLSEQLAMNMVKSKERVDHFVAKNAPRYRPILSRIPEEELNIDPNISDKDLELILHKHLSRIEGELLTEGHNIMAPKADENEIEYTKRLQAYSNKVEDIKKSDLANYVFHRRVILDLLERAIQIGPDGKYAREDMIHNLIMPMGKESNEVFLDSCNLWLVDERLAFHNYLASDKPLVAMPITGSTETKKPDIVAINVFDVPILVSDGTKLPLASIVVIEIKRPMRNDAGSGEKDDPIEQALGYLDRIREGKVQTANHRPIPNSSDIPGFCYVLADLTPSFEARCKVHALQKTSDGLGYFGYNPNFKAYIEVISFDRLVNAAKERNRAFFDKLGLPAN